MILFDTIRDALENAKFGESDIRKYLNRLLDLLEADLEEVDYQESSLVETAIVNLAGAIQDVEKDESEITKSPARDVTDEDKTREPVAPERERESLRDESVEIDAPSRRATDDLDTR